MPFAQRGAPPQMGGNGPMPFPQPGAAPQMGKNRQMPSPQEAIPYTGGSVRGPSQHVPMGAPPVMNSNPMPAPGDEPYQDMDFSFSFKALPPPPGSYVPRATPEPFRMLPKRDDFNTPIKWVPVSSAKVEDGIAKVTDMDTGRNFNIVINGTIFVPVIDDSIVPTVAPPTTMVPFVPQTTTENFAMRALLQFVTPEELNRNDWLGFDAALNRGETQREVAPPTTMVPFVPQTTTENFAMRALLQFVTPEELNRNDWLGFDAALNRGETQRECIGSGCTSSCIGKECKATVCACTQ
ncbi:hypothetical protein MSG28_015643 [Choristoneura fumiferana]|uniref:Uncharacterized protein n=1 Tax=Choristoneura fumiferana TaxID=7141 RepID=A0ACC0KBK2_CHOFU|nr:hypothetical protein MSG28_015643 [Choristoneura fumiferana]